MRKAIFSGLLLSLASAPALPGQGKAVAMDMAKQVQQQTSLDAAGQQPWHLKLNVTLFDAQNKPVQGTVEQWWWKQDEYRTEWTTPSYRATVVRDGTRFLRTENTADAPYLLWYLLRQTVHPGPPATLPPDSGAEVTKRRFGKVELNCLALFKADPKNSRHTTPSMGGQYCADPSGTLIATSQGPTQLAIREKVGLFHTVQVPVDLAISANGKIVARSHIEGLGSLTATKMPEADTSGLVPAALSPRDHQDGASSTAVNKVAPVYPAMAKQMGITGSVYLETLIGTDGRVKSVDPIYEAQPQLVAAAEEAVRQWVYQPVLVDGVPVEFESIVTVNFEIAH